MEDTTDLPPGTPGCLPHKGHCCKHLSKHRGAPSFVPGQSRQGDASVSSHGSMHYNAAWPGPVWACIPWVLMAAEAGKTPRSTFNFQLLGSLLTPLHTSSWTTGRETGRLCVWAQCGEEYQSTVGHLLRRPWWGWVMEDRQCHD